MSYPHPGPGNGLLASLPAADLALLQPHLREVPLLQGERLHRDGEAIDSAYFPRSGAISIVVPMDEGTTVQVAMIGREGVLGAGAALGLKGAINDAIVQAAGSAMRIASGKLARALAQSEPLRDLMARHEALMMLRAQQTVACNALHSVEARMCRWMLELRDRIDGDTMAFTQELLAERMGVQRTTVTAVSRKLQALGAIECRRGHIRLAARSLIEEAVCACYGRMRDRAASMIPEIQSPMAFARPAASALVPGVRAT